MSPTIYRRIYFPYINAIFPTLVLKIFNAEVMIYG